MKRRLDVAVDSQGAASLKPLGGSHEVTTQVKSQHYKWIAGLVPYLDRQ